MWRGIHKKEMKKEEKAKKNCVHALFRQFFMGLCRTHNYCIVMCMRMSFVYINYISAL